MEGSDRVIPSPLNLIEEERGQGGGISQSWAQSALLPFPSRVALCLLHSVTRASVKWAHPPCRVFVGNVWAKQLIQSLALHSSRSCTELLGLPSLIGPHL